jgi:TolB-like protein/class 3 adenylate cyclase/Tfp pilus assembly protein PilF
MVADQPGRVERRLAAILAADVAGYSRLMGLDEVGTARILRENRIVADALVAKHGGRIVKTTGDGILLEFPSVVDAVECAVAVQAVMAERNDGVPRDRRMLFRIGINLGDVLIEGEDILGDGVNVAARLEGIAEPGGICVSSSAYDQVRGKVAIAFTDLGEQSLKNIARPVRVYAVAGDGPGQAASVMPSVSRTPSLSIVVLPFTNIGGDPEQEYFVDGVTESLTTDLSRMIGSFVIGRNTAFTYKGKHVDLKRVGQDLGVRYVLEGSVQRGSNRMRVNVQLIDAETGNHSWAERFDKPITDLFDMQDEIVARLANQLGTELVAAEARRAERTLHPVSMDLYLQGMAHANRGASPEYLAQARDYFERALALDPGNIEALVGTATVDARSASYIMADERAALLAAAEATLTKVLSLAPNHAMAHCLLGMIKIYSKRAVQGIAECERALALDRNLAVAHAQIGFAKYVTGRGEQTEAHVREALRLSPRDTNANVWMVWVGNAKSQLGADEEAVVWLHQAIETNRNLPIGYFFLAAALVLVDRQDEARGAALAGLALDPSFTVRRFRVSAASDNPTYLTRRERIYDGMRQAGVPEG